MKEIKNFINGEVRHQRQRQDLREAQPGRQLLIGMVHEAGQPEVDAAVAAARAALHGPWGKLSVVDRCAMLDGLVAEINHRFDDFLQAEIADTGKPAHLASHIDIPRGAANFKIFTDTIKNVSTESFEMRTPDGKTARSYGVRTPRGVIAIICPWNLPLLLMTWKCGPAMACGNTVVVKPSEATPSTATLLGEVMNKVGVPPGVYNVVNGFGVNSAGSFLTAHQGVNGITFTGETKTGTAIMKAGADGIRPVSLELGGKNAAVVFADCDFENAVVHRDPLGFENCGQVCLGTERVYVERPIFDKFVAALKEQGRADEARPPVRPDTKIGPLVSKIHQKKVLSYYPEAKEEGANIVFGGGVPDMPDDLKDGCWVEPTIWTGLPETATVVREEIFGPCCHIQPFDTEEEAVRMANDTKLRPGHLDLHARHQPRQPPGDADRGRPVLDQQLVPARPAHPVWRLQAVGHRPRRRCALAGVLHRAAQRDDQVLSAAHERAAQPRNRQQSIRWPTGIQHHQLPRCVAPASRCC
jgi:aminomuconate-semialdehyde/2-hydroxymuconate-6-semialdehyde dehydrogenase